MWTAQISKIPEVWLSWAILQVWLFGQNYSISNFSVCHTQIGCWFWGMYAFFFFIWFFFFSQTDIVVMISIGKYISLFLEYLWSTFGRIFLDSVDTIDLISYFFIIILFSFLFSLLYIFWWRRGWAFLKRWKVTVTLKHPLFFDLRKPLLWLSKYIIKMVGWYFYLVLRFLNHFVLNCDFKWAI